jgi:hypothetical protein
MATEEEKKASEPNDDIQALISLSKTPHPTDFLSVVKLDLFQAGLNSLPSDLPKRLPNLSILFCMKNEFTELPEIIGRCAKLQMVSFKSNKLNRIQNQALQEQLRWLILTDNQISEIPETIGNCLKLQKCMLSGNKITSLPNNIANCKNLELIRLASNQLQEPPLTLLKLPRLSWVALSDNPFLNHVMDGYKKELPTLKVFEDPLLDDPSKAEKELGRGASGIIRQYSLNGKESVAVKEYFSTITSDGNPQEERQVSMVASSLQCSSLINVKGRTSKGSLIMKLLTNYKVLANPPSLESCSRDVYDKEGTQISTIQAVSMIKELLWALTQLHQQGICHGDFYGHNILYNEENSWLTDFGAAFFYESQAEYGRLIQSIEQRAFGHLVTEVTELIPENKNNDQEFHVMQQLASWCNKNETFETLYEKVTAALNFNNHVANNKRKAASIAE